MCAGTILVPNLHLCWQEGRADAGDTSALLRDVRTAAQVLEEVKPVTKGGGGSGMRRPINKADAPPDIGRFQTNSQRRRNLPLSKLKRVKPKRRRRCVEVGCSLSSRVVIAAENVTAVGCGRATSCFFSLRYAYFSSLRPCCLRDAWSLFIPVVRSCRETRNPARTGPSFLLLVDFIEFTILARDREKKWKIPGKPWAPFYGERGKSS